MKNLYLIVAFLILSIGAASAQKTDSALTPTLDTPTDNWSDKIFTSVQVPPEFPGGPRAFSAFVSKNIVYPAVARQNGIEGRVIVNFVIEKDGSLTNIKVLRGIGGGCDEEAVRVMKLCPNWIHASQSGHAVRISYSVPISFSN